MVASVAINANNAIIVTALGVRQTLSETSLLIHFRHDLAVAQFEVVGTAPGPGSNAPTGTRPLLSSAPLGEAWWRSRAAPLRASGRRTPILWRDSLLVHPGRQVRCLGPDVLREEKGRAQVSTGTAPIACCQPSSSSASTASLTRPKGRSAKTPMPPAY